MSTDGAASAFTLAGPWVDVAATGEGVTSLGSAPLSGTSFAAPFVSGLAALIRARFPTLTARQVMQRIESTAHHPPGGWNPFVGNGAVDVLAAVSTDANPPGNTAKPRDPAVPLSPPPPPRRRTPHGRATALRGATDCLVALVAVLAHGATKPAARPVKGPRDGVSGD